MVQTVDELVNTCPPLHRATASLCVDVFGSSQQLTLQDDEGRSPATLKSRVFAHKSRF